jgi:signal transduction histidine kinase/CheY-like chemotaxis protein
MGKCQSKGIKVKHLDSIVGMSHLLCDNRDKGIILFEKISGKIMTINKQIETLFSANYIDIIGRHINSFIPLDIEDFIHSTNRIVKILNCEEHSLELEIDIFTESFIKDNMVMLLINEISARKENIVFKKAIKEEKDYHTALSAQAVHELKTPIQSILCITDLLLSGESFNINSIQIIKDSSLVMNELINNLIDIHTMDQSTHTINYSIMWNYIQLLNHLSNIIQPLTTSYRVNVIFHSPETILDLKETVFFDSSTKIYQLLLNLISNAIKFSNNVDVFTKFTILKDNNILLRVEIVDDGPGLSEQVNSRLYSMFNTDQNNQKNKHIKGSGIGLSVCKKIVEFLNGDIGYVRKNKTTFWFEVPLVLKTSLPSVNISEDSHRQYLSSMNFPISVNHSPKISLKKSFDLNKFKILIVEDVEINRRLLSKIIRKLDYDVESAADGIEAMEKLEKDKFNVVITDIQMPNMNGYVLAEKIKQRFKHIKVVALSGDSQSSITSIKNFDCILSKPIERDILNQNLNYLFSQ